MHTKPRARGFIRLKTFVYLILIAAFGVGAYTGFPYAKKRFELKREVVKLANQCMRPDRDIEHAIDRFMTTVADKLSFTLYRSDIFVEPDREFDTVEIRVRALVPYELPFMEKRFHDVTVTVNEKRRQI